MGSQVISVLLGDDIGVATAQTGEWEFSPFCSKTKIKKFAHRVGVHSSSIFSPNECLLCVSPRRSTLKKAACPHGAPNLGRERDTVSKIWQNSHKGAPCWTLNSAICPKVCGRVDWLVGPASRSQRMRLWRPLVKVTAMLRGDGWGCWQSTRSCPGPLSACSARGRREYLGG